MPLQLMNGKHLICAFNFRPKILRNHQQIGSRPSNIQSTKELLLVFVASKPQKDSFKSADRSSLMVGRVTTTSRKNARHLDEFKFQLTFSVFSHPIWYTRLLTWCGTPVGTFTHRSGIKNGGNETGEGEWNFFFQTASNLRMHPEISARGWRLL